MTKIHKMAAQCAAACAAMATLYASPALAQTSSSDANQEISALKQQVQALMKRVDELSARSYEASNRTAAIQAPAAPAAALPLPTTAAAATQALQRKPGSGFTVLTRGGELSLYGNLDVSLDDTSKGLGNARAADGSTPSGRTGWLPAISSNLSYVGIRGFQALGTLPFNFVYQLETQIDISATSGTAETNSNTSNAVKGGLTSRNSFVGIASASLGALKIGKTDAPYKTSTARLNAFNGMIGDYAVIMGNTGGDNRVEFGTRLDHAIWYESPNLHGLTASVLLAPGQNRGYDNSNIAAGEGDCSGGNIPGSGGTPAACNDGSYGNAYSASVAYSAGPLYLTAAYEQHMGVNRTSDLGAFDPKAVANEHAAKLGAQYKLPTNTTISAIWETMRREVPAYLQYQNERSRNGYWFAVSQDLGAADSIHFGWAHAGRANGDPGQHNTDAGAGVDNAADMYSLAWRHTVDPNLSVYLDFAVTNNHQYAHYDLGAGGRGVTTDCHDASNPDTSGFDPNGDAPHCYAGGKLRGVSAGIKYSF